MSYKGLSCIAKTPVTMPTGVWQAKGLSRETEGKPDA
jgi:hypothetical protein